MPTSRPARRQMTVSNEPSDVRRGLILFRRFFVGVRRLGHGPRIVLLLGFGNALERFLIGLVIDLWLFVRGVCIVALMSSFASPHLRLNGHSQKCQYRRSYRQGPHRNASP